VKPFADSSVAQDVRHGTNRRCKPLAVAVLAARIALSPIRILLLVPVLTPPVLETQMTLSMTHLQPIVALIAGVLILIMPRLLNFIVAIYLILVGIIGLGIIK
jgi:hypothetical protein